MRGREGEFCTSFLLIWNVTHYPSLLPSLLQKTLKSIRGLSSAYWLDVKSKVRDGGREGAREGRIWT